MELISWSFFQTQASVSSVNTNAK